MSSEEKSTLRLFFADQPISLRLQRAGNAADAAGSARSKGWKFYSIVSK
jgi:hypothetical protein